MPINRVFITGNVTRDPELRMTASGTAVLTIPVAFDDRRRNADTGEWEDVPNYVDAVMFGNRAMSLADHLRKGVRVAVEGKLRWQSWERDGQKRSKIDVVADELEFMSAPKAQ